MKKLLMNKKITKNNTSKTITLHPMQLQMLGIDVGDEVNVYVSGKRIIIEKKEV